MDPFNTAYSSLNGVLFNKTQTQLVQYPPGLSGSYTVPNTVTNINEGSFAQLYYLTGITLPDSVISIGTNAFGQSSMTNVTFGRGLKSIAWDAFSYSQNPVHFYFEGNPPASVAFTAFYSDGSSTVYYMPGTSGWGTSFQGMPSVLWNPYAQTADASFGIQNNKFGFNITGNSNLVVVVEACTNLANPVWTPLSTNVLTGGSSPFSDAQWTNYPGRFYHFRTP